MNAPTLRTYLWMAGSAFIVAASLAFVAYLRFHLSWWSMVLILGTLVGAIVALLEWSIAGPLERLARGPGRTREGVLVAPPAPTARFAAAESKRLWRGMRALQEQATTLRSAHAGLETRIGRSENEARLLREASALLRPDASTAEAMPGLLRGLAGLLGVPNVWLVPLRRHCPVPVLGPDGEPEWGQELRAGGLEPWDDMLALDRPLAVCLTDRAPYWRRHFAHETLWIVPLVYHKRAQGFLLARPEGADRAFTPDELALLEALAPLIAAALHPPRWSEVRRRDKTRVDDDMQEEPSPDAASEPSWLVTLAEAPPPEREAEAPSPPPVAEPVQPPPPAPNRRERRRRQRERA